MTGRGKEQRYALSEEKFEKLCSRVRESVGEELLTLTKKYTPDIDRLVELANSDYELFDDYEISQTLGEVGCPICMRGDEIFLGEISEPETGAGCRLRPRSCQRMGGDYIGSFHTHPLGGTTPSGADMMHQIKETELISCIGGEVGGEHKVTCYGLRGLTGRDLSLKIGSPSILEKPYYPNSDDIEPVGEISFYREVPPPTPDDVYDALITHTDEVVSLISMYHEIGEDDPDMPKYVEEFYDELRAGELPDEYCAVDNLIAGEMDSISVVGPDGMKIIEQRNLEKLKEDFFICRL